MTSVTEHNILVKLSDKFVHSGQLERIKYLLNYCFNKEIN